ncbi:DUF805 domain-containing protein [Salinispora fenicalii]|uniref:DUF805 domain-containing protein n=1 Tax=Salinispora fenicalii TaxID=1137263 RepID=UPI0009E97EB9|nr:DUF805 domain-containing protein [Salinispora fenicalii]
MVFVDAIRSVLTQYVGFRGRARRSDYWWFYLFTSILNILAACLSGAADGSLAPKALVYVKAFGASVFEVLRPVRSGPFDRVRIGALRAFVRGSVFRTLRR